MRKAMKVAWVLLIASFALGSLWAGVAGARSNRWVEVWCDSDVTNGDGAAIDLLVVNGQTIAGADDRIGRSWTRARWIPATRNRQRPPTTRTQAPSRGGTAARSGTGTAPSSRPHHRRSKLPGTFDEAWRVRAA
jgi:hypothetical protein